MNNMELRKHLLDNMNKMLNWISEEFKKADCDVPYHYEFAYGFIYGHHDYDKLHFWCKKEPQFLFHHYGGCERVKNGKLYDRDGEEYTQSYLTNPNWYIPKENVEGFQKAMDEWPRVKAAVLAHLESVKNVSNFEV